MLGTWLDVRGQAVSQDEVEDGVRMDEDSLFWIHHGIVTWQILKQRNQQVKTKPNNITGAQM